MPGLDPPPRERIRKPLFHEKTIAGLLLLVGLFSSLLAFLVSARDCFQYPGVDLRCRVVAARAIRMGLDPYQYEWREGMSEQLLDPTRRHPGPSRATYPPTLLMLYVPLSGFPYQTQRAIWFLLEWSALVASLSLLLGVVRSRAARTALLALGMFFFVSGDLWRFHVERGQFYVFVLLLMALGTRSLVRHGREDWRTGIFFGLAAALRPTFFLMALPLAVLGYRKSAVAMAATLAIAIALTLPWVGLQGWACYLETMRVWEQAAGAVACGEDPFLRTYGPARPVPTTAEGIDFFHILPIETAGSTVLANFYPVYSGLRRLVALPPLITIARIGLLAFVFAVGGVAVSLRWRTRAVSPRFIAALGALACIDGEYFLPIRFSYADILFLLPLALLIPALLRLERMGFARTFVIAGLVLGGHRSLIGRQAEPIEFLFLAFGLTVALLQLAKKEKGRGKKEGKRREKGDCSTVTGADLSLTRQESGESTWEPVNDSEWATNSANGSISSLIVWTGLQPPGNVATVSEKGTRREKGTSLMSTVREGKEPREYARRHLLTVTDFGGMDVGIPQAMRRSIDFAANSRGTGAG